MKQSPLITMDVIGGSVLFVSILVLTILAFHHHEANSQKFLSAAHILAIAYVGVMIAVGSAVMAASK